MPYSKERSKAARKFVREHNTAAKLKDNKATIKKRKNVMSDFIFIVSIFDLIETSDFEMLCKLLGLNIESEWLEKEYDDIKRGQGDAYLFQSCDSCLFLDLFREPTDQNEMILVGVRCKQELSAKIKVIVASIYEKASVKGVQLYEGTNILDRLIDGNNYPMERSTITIMNGKETYRFFQKLKVFQNRGGNLL